MWNTSTGALTAARVQGLGPALTYDGRLIPQSVSTPGGVTATLNSLSLGNTYRQRYGSAVLDAAFWRSNNYDAAGRVDVQYQESATNIAQRKIFYDGRGRVTSLRDSTHLTGGSTCDTAGDPNYGSDLCATITSTTFTSRDSVAYDIIGNAIYVLQSAGVTGTASYTKNQLGAWPRAGGGLDTVYHNDPGRRVERQNGTGPRTYYRYTADDLMDTIRIGSAPVTRRIAFEYNAFGQLARRKSVVGASNTLTIDRHYVWDRDNLLAELDGTLAQRRSEYAHYPGLDQPFALLTGATTVTSTRWIQRDLEGNVIGLTTSAGAVDNDVLGTDAWGWPQGSSAVADTVRLRWKGMLYESDPDVQLYYVRARWYDPKTRRFMVEDPIGLAGGGNPYVFAANDPINLSDPDGLKPCERGYNSELYEEVWNNETKQWDCRARDGGGGGQSLPGVTVTGARDPWANFGGPSRNFGNPCARGGRCDVAGGTWPAGSLSSLGVSLSQVTFDKAWECVSDQFGLGELASLGAAVSGLNNISTRAKPKGAIQGTSIASKAAGTIFRDAELPGRFPTIVGNPLVGSLALRKTKSVARFVGRGVPVLGWGFLAYDAVSIGICVVNHD